MCFFATIYSLWMLPLIRTSDGRCSTHIQESDRSTEITGRLPFQNTRRGFSEAEGAPRLMSRPEIPRLLPPKAPPIDAVAAPVIHFQFGKLSP